MEKEGTKQIPVVGKDDKREITVLITVAATGDMLPPQVIYKGARLQDAMPKLLFPRIGPLLIVRVIGALKLQCLNTLIMFWFHM